MHNLMPGPRFGRLGAAVAAALCTAAPAFAQAPIILPGAPGEPSRLISAEEATDLASVRFSAADVQFLTGMIAHHAQALEMTALVDGRTNRDAIRLLSQRIELSQADEIEMMQQWLRDRSLDVPEPAAHTGHDTELMPGMASAEQMASLADANGAEFDTLFLELMIEHHRGALTMVDELLEQPGSAQDFVLFDFTADIRSDQQSEIERMDGMLAGFSPDPRVALKAGFEDAGHAALHMELVAALPKPPGFFDPEHPAGRPMERPRRNDARTRRGEQDGEEGETESGNGNGNGNETTTESDPSAANTAADLARGAQTAARRQNDAGGQAAHEHPDDAGRADAAEHGDEHRETVARADDPAADRADGGETDDGDADDRQHDARSEPRPSLLSFANTDLVFADDVLVAGNYHGFNAYAIGDPRAPELLSSVVCPGGQGDVSIVGHLLIYSVEQTRGRLDCGLHGAAGEASGERFRGIRIFDVSDFRMPRQVGAVQTCRGSHTHTVVTDPDDSGRFYVYASGTSFVRSGDELEGCADDSPFENPDTALFRIDVVEIPIDDPAAARVVNRPYIFSDPESGVIAGLWDGGDHGPNTQETFETNQCHDITVFAELGVAAGACAGNGILLDISDPVNPVRIHEVIDPGFAYWHSATFNNDGTKVIFTDEWGGGARPRCRASDPKNWGANAIFDIVDGKMEFRSYFKMPAPQTEQENCVAHNGSLVPVPGRDVFVQAWYQGGISVIDFTDSSNPIEIAFFDRGPVDEADLIMGGYWSAYWHDGFVYGTEIARGLDVLALTPSEYLSANEITAASLASRAGVVNPQQQRRHDWPAEPVVALAYVDQLTRGLSLDAPRASAITAALKQADALLGAGERDADAAAELERLAAALRPVAQRDGAVNGRAAALAGTMGQIADRLR